MRKMIYRTLHRIGRRAMSILLYSLLWFCVGLERIIAPQPPYLPEAHMGLHNWLDSVTRGYIWVTIALVSVVLVAVWPRTRWGQSLAFGLLVLMPLFNVVTWAQSAIAYYWPTGDTGLPYASILTLIWTAVAVKVMTDAGWNEDSAYPVVQANQE